jgi:hypothetical protein
MRRIFDAEAINPALAPNTRGDLLSHVKRPISAVLLMADVLTFVGERAWHCRMW